MVKTNRWPPVLQGNLLIYVSQVIHAGRERTRKSARSSESAPGPLHFCRGVVFRFRRNKLGIRVKMPAIHWTRLGRETKKKKLFALHYATRTSGGGGGIHCVVHNSRSSNIKQQAESTQTERSARKYAQNMRFNKLPAATSLLIGFKGPSETVNKTATFRDPAVEGPAWRLWGGGTGCFVFGIGWG